MNSRNYSALEKAILRAFLLVLVLYALSLILDITLKASRLIDPPRKRSSFGGPLELPGPPGLPW